MRGNKSSKLILKDWKYSDEESTKTTTTNASVVSTKSTSTKIPTITPPPIITATTRESLEKKCLVLADKLDKKLIHIILADVKYRCFC